MHDWIMNIGYAILKYFYSIDVESLKDALYIMGIGMLGIFIVTGVIILTITLCSARKLHPRRRINKYEI